MSGSLDKALAKEDVCPKCLGELDTGWECTKCGYDARQHIGAFMDEIDRLVQEEAWGTLAALAKELKAKNDVLLAALVSLDETASEIMAGKKLTNAGAAMAGAASVLRDIVRKAIGTLKLTE